MQRPFADRQSLSKVAHGSAEVRRGVRAVGAGRGRREEVGSPVGHANVLEADAVRSREQNSLVAVPATSGARAEEHHERPRAISAGRDEPTRQRLGSDTQVPGLPACLAARIQLLDTHRGGKVLDCRQRVIDHSLARPDDTAKRRIGSRVCDRCKLI